MPTGTEMPEFEGLEPEEEEFEEQDDFDSWQESYLDLFDEFPMDNLGGQEFGVDLEYPGPQPEYSEFDDEYDQLNPSASLASLAARTALKWGRQVAATSDFGFRRGRPASPRLPRIPGDMPGDPRLSRPTAGLMAGASAALVEDLRLMDMLATAAASTANDAAATALIASAVPLSLRLAPSVYRALWPALPALVNGASGVTRLLHRRLATRPLIRIMPMILKRTVRQLAKRYTRGQPVTGEGAAQILAVQVAGGLQQWSRPRRTASHSTRSGRRRQRPPGPYANAEWGDDGYGA